VWLIAPIWVAVASALAMAIYLQLRTVAVPRPGPNAGPAVIDPLDVIKTTIAVAGFVGAVLVGVYGYRKQRLIEGDARRADAEQLAQRYTRATDQLGHEKSAVRLGGVYALARLADDWDEQRQVCIDVLCAYLRMPYETDTASEKHRAGEREVRHTIIRIIRDHLQDPAPTPNAPIPWCGHDFDFTNATFDGGDFTSAKFTGGKVSFDGAKFIAGQVTFRDAEFVGGEVSFENAKFTGGQVYFISAKFTGSEVSFSFGKFTGSEISFVGAEFTGGQISFVGANFTGGQISFNDAGFTGGEVDFSVVEFNGGKVSFSFAEFTGGKIDFSGASYTGGKVAFNDAEFTGSRIIWGRFEPPAAWTALQERER
jgi:uncharacterized protein YjbI with pentapeptide repeats